MNKKNNTYNQRGTYNIQTEEGVVLEKCRTKFYAVQLVKKLNNKLKVKLIIVKVK